MKLLDIFKIDKEKQQFQKKKYEFEEKFYDLMYHLEFKNKSLNTYHLSIEKRTKYGYQAKLYLATGLSFIELQKHIGTIQENLQCIWIMETKPFQEYAKIKIVTKPLDNEIPYECPNIKPWEIYLGLDFSLEVIKSNNNEFCMFLLAGATGSGKTRFLFMVVLSWVLSCKINEVEIYLADVVKDGFAKFRYCKMVRAYATELKELLLILQYLEIKLKKRRKIMSPLRENGIATNIEEFNRTQKSKMSYCYFVTDEFSFLMPDKSDKKEDKELKEEIVDLIKKLEKAGREMGIFVLNGLQKTTKDEIPPIIKSQSSVRISFTANDPISSEVIMGDHSAVGLMKRYAVYSKNGGEKNYLFSPKLTTEMLNTLLQPHIDKNFKKIDLEYEIKASNQPQILVVQGKKLDKETKKKLKEKYKNSHYPTINTNETKTEFSGTADNSITIIKGDEDNYVDN